MKASIILPGQQTIQYQYFISTYRFKNAPNLKPCSEAVHILMLSVGNVGVS